MNWVVAGKWFAAGLVLMAWLFAFEWLLREDHQFWLGLYAVASAAVCMGWVSAQLGEDGSSVTRHGSNGRPPYRMPLPPSPPPRKP